MKKVIIFVIKSRIPYIKYVFCRCTDLGESAQQRILQRRRAANVNKKDSYFGQKVYFLSEVGGY